MTETPNPMAPHHLPWFITAPGETDVLLVVMAIFLIVLLILFGILYLNLHHLPERLAHETPPRPNPDGFGSGAAGDATKTSSG